MPWSNSRPAQAKYRGNWPQIRKQWAKQHKPWHPCVRCGYELGPMGPGLHLDHDDVHTDIVRGFAHARCNVRAAAIKANTRSSSKRAPITPLTW